MINQLIALETDVIPNWPTAIVAVAVLAFFGFFCWLMVR